MADRRVASADPRRSIPAVGKLLLRPQFDRLSKVYGRQLVRVHLRRQLEVLRSDSSEPNELPAPRELADQLAAAVERDLRVLVGEPLRRVINATGVFLHTNLGRAPLPADVAADYSELLTAACDLELDLATNRRDDRNRRSELLLRQLTGAEAALVVNNNAAALVLILAAVARGREVLVSRGELVEIGGSFRIPDILEAAGVRLVEVGTTNRTRIDDYEAALGAESALLLKVHPSNYRIRGFTENVEAEELVELGRRHQLPVAVDEGSGLLVPHRAPQLRDHRSLRELVAVGCDLSCGSGDKVLGAPQAGLIVGSGRFIERCRRHPLYRAMRPSRSTFVGLEPILRKKLAQEPMPIDGLWPDAEAHHRRLESVARVLGAELVAADAFVGGGAAPEAPIPGLALALPEEGRLLGRLRRDPVPVVGYARDGAVRLDLRTVDPRDDQSLIDTVLRALSAVGGG